MSEFVDKMSALTGKSVENLTAEFSDFLEVVNRQFEGRLEGDELASKAESLFRQKCRSVIKTNESSGAVPVMMFVSGISDTQDKMRWQRSKAIDVYKLNPNKAIMEGRVNEYTITDKGVMKRSFDQAEQEVVETMIKERSPNSEEADVLVFVAPVDNQPTGFGGKPNKNFGQELPLNKFSCYVHGVAEIEGSDDVRWTKFMLRGKNANEYKIEVNKSYKLGVINMTDKGSEEYNFIDTDDLVAEEIEWNPFEGEFMEEVIEMPFIQDRVYALGDMDEVLRTMEADKDAGTFKDWNGAFLVEADVSRIFISDKPNVSDRMFVDDDSLRWGEDEVEGNINVWISSPNKIDFGEYSRLLITCSPSRNRPPRDAPEGTKGSLQLNAHGLFAFAKYKTRFEQE